MGYFGEERSVLFNALVCRHTRKMSRPREAGGRRPNLANLAQEESLHFLQRKLIVLDYESFLSLIDT